jgi:hypothetical protein
MPVRSQFAKGVAVAFGRKQKHCPTLPTMRLPDLALPFLSRPSATFPSVPCWQGVLVAGPVAVQPAVVPLVVALVAALPATAAAPAVVVQLAPVLLRPNAAGSQQLLPAKQQK